MVSSTGADVVIAGGTVIDPAQELHAARDVVITDGKIAALTPPGAAPSAERVLDARGLLVTPGLIDLHTHVYLHVGQDNIDANSLAARSGTTTMVDAGSAGAAIFDGFRHYVAARARCRLLALLNISVIGTVASPMAGYGRFVDPTFAAETVEANRDLIVGVKVLGSRIRVGEDNTDQPVWHAHAAARAAGVPLMLHIGDPPPTITQSIPILDRGDLITHCYKGELVGRLVDRDGTPTAVLREARERGVLMDVGHGAGSYHWEVARQLCGHGYWPDTISTDVHAGSINGPAYDMPTTMSKLLHLGMPLDAVIRASTLRPAQAIGWDDRIGSLEVGRTADVAVLELQSGAFPLTDTFRQTETASSRLVARHTIFGGEVISDSGTSG